MDRKRIKYSFVFHHFVAWNTIVLVFLQDGFWTRYSTYVLNSNTLVGSLFVMRDSTENCTFWLFIYPDFNDDHLRVYKFLSDNSVLS